MFCHTLLTGLRENVTSRTLISVLSHFYEDLIFCLNPSLQSKVSKIHWRFSSWNFFFKCIYALAFTSSIYTPCHQQGSCCCAVLALSKIVKNFHFSLSTYWPFSSFERLPHLLADTRRGIEQLVFPNGSFLLFRPSLLLSCNWQKHPSIVVAYAMSSPVILQGCCSPFCVLPCCWSSHMDSMFVCLFFK